MKLSKNMKRTFTTLIQTYVKLENKKMLRLILSILLITLSFNAFSQSVTKTQQQTDTTRIVLPVSIAREVIKELLAYDAVKQEIIILEELVKQKDSIAITYVRVIDAKDSQINNLQSSILLQTEQLTTQTQLTLELESALKVTKVQNRILKIGSVGTFVGGIAIGFFLLR